MRLGMIGLGYERLLYDCMVGNATLFQRSDVIQAAWNVEAPIQDLWGAPAERRGGSGAPSASVHPAQSHT